MMPIATAQLSPRQKQVLQLIADGKTFSQVGLALGIGKRTVNKHVAVARRKYGVVSTYALIAHATARGDIEVTFNLQDNS